MLYNNIKKSISIIENSGIDYEFRTTIVKEFHSTQDIKEILDKVLPNWTDINTQFTDEQFEICFAKIDGLVKEKLIKPESDWSFLE